MSHLELEVPCVMFLCDADGYLLQQERTTVNTVSAQEIIDLFLNGRCASPYRGVRSRSRCINAVVACRIKEDGSGSRAKPLRRNAIVDVIRNCSETHYALDESALKDTRKCFRHLPRIGRSPGNTGTLSKRPEHYGGHCIGGGGHGKMKI